MVRRHHGYQALSARIDRKACRIGSAATCPPGSLFGLFSAQQQAAHSGLIPTPRQQGVDSEEAKTKAPYRIWARLLGRVFDLAMASCPFYRRAALHIISAIRQEEVTTRILRHLKLASEPPPIAPARLRQAILAFDEAAAGIGL